MNWRTFRIVFASLLLVGGLGAAYTTVRALGTQTSWTQAVEKAVADVKTAEKDLPALAARERSLKNQLAAANVNYGAPLVAANPQVNADGSVIVNLGTQDGLDREGAPDGTGPIVHLFAPSGEGNASVYVGPFAILESRERQASLAPAFDVRPGEPQTWPVGRGGWRIRYDVPASRAGRFTDLDASLLVQREALRNRLATLETRRRSVAEAEGALAARERELFGDPDAPEVADAPEVRSGVVAAIAADDDARSAALAELDRLRRAVKNAQDRLTELLAENERAVEGLPTAGPPRTARGQ